MIFFLEILGIEKKNETKQNKTKFSDLGGIGTHGIRVTSPLLFLVSYKTTMVEDSTWMSLIKSFMCIGYSY